MPIIARSKPLPRLVFISSLYIFLSCVRHYLLQSGVYDLGLFTQWLHLISSGSLWETSSLTDYTKPPLGDHFSLVLIPLSFIYRVFPCAYTLLIVQSIGLGVLVELFLGQLFRSLPNQKYSDPLALTIVFTPVLFNSNLNDFHPEIALSFLGFMALMFLRDNKLLKSFALLVCFIATKEAMAIFGVSYSIYAFFRRHRIYGLAVAIFCLVYFKISSDIVSEYQDYAVSRYSQLGLSYPEIIINVLKNPFLVLSELFSRASLEYLCFLLMPFISLLFWPGSLCAIVSTAPLLLSNLLSSSDAMTNPIYQYHLPIMILILIAVLDGLNASKDSAQIPSSNTSILKGQRVFLQILFGVISLTLFTQYSYFSTSYTEYLSIAADVRKVSIELRDPTFRVWAHERIAPHFSSRPFIDYKEDQLFSQPYDFIIYPQRQQSTPPSNLLIKLRNRFFSYGSSNQFNEADKHIKLLIRQGYQCNESGNLYVCNRPGN